MKNRVAGFALPMSLENKINLWLPSMISPSSSIITGFVLSNPFREFMDSSEYLVSSKFGFICIKFLTLV